MKRPKTPSAMNSMHSLNHSFTLSGTPNSPTHCFFRHSLLVSTFLTPFLTPISCNVDHLSLGFHAIHLLLEPRTWSLAVKGMSPFGGFFLPYFLVSWNRFMLIFCFICCYSLLFLFFYFFFSFVYVGFDGGSTHTHSHIVECINYWIYWNWPLICFLKISVYWSQWFGR